MIRERLAAWDRLGASYIDPRGATVELMLLKLGDVLRATGDEAGALEAYTEGTRRRPTSTSFYLRMAKLFADKGHLDEAEQIARRGKAAGAAYRDGGASSVASLSSRS